MRNYLAHLVFSMSVGLRIRDKVLILLMHHMFSICIRIKLFKGLLYSQRKFTLQFEHDNKRMICNLRLQDIPIFFEIWQDEIYSLQYLKIEPKLIIDMGANVGFASLFFSSSFPNCQIIAIEPSETNLKLLFDNCSALLNIKIIPKAITKDGRAVFFDDLALGYNAKIKDQASHGKPVPSMSIDSLFLEKWSPIILKIDIEGGELELFEKHATWLDCIDLLLIEVHSTEIENIVLEKTKSHGLVLVEKEKSVLKFIREL